jgi:hypothetical protein
MLNMVMWYEGGTSYQGINVDKGAQKTGKGSMK